MNMTQATQSKQNKTTVTAEPGQLCLTITREFDAPRELVFRAYTDVNAVAKWLGPRELTMRIEKYDARSGGEWRYLQADADGNEYGFHGVFHEVLSPERIIQTFEFEGMPEAGHVVLETLRLEALPGNRTRLVGLSVFQTLEDRDGMVAAGMEGGVVDSYARLDEVLRTLE